MRKKIVAGNWKMNNNFQETKKFLSQIKVKEIGSEVEVMIAPAYPFLKFAKDFLEGTKYEIIAQNIHNKLHGAFTGEVSVDMIKSLGLNKSIIGHSERRSQFKETDEILLEKVNLCLNEGLGIIFCFGEDLVDRQSKNYFEVVKNQLINTVLKVEKNKWSNIVLAYEPVWAIGTGETASPEQAQEIHEFVRDLVSSSLGEDVSKKTSILYGGSVKAGNAKEIFSQDDVDGGLIGGASLISEDFLTIIESNSSY